MSSQNFKVGVAILAAIPLAILLFSRQPALTLGSRLIRHARNRHESDDIGPQPEGMQEEAVYRHGEHKPKNIPPSSSHAVSRLPKRRKKKVDNPDNPNWALIIGINDYAIKPLDGAVKDALSQASWLEDNGIVHPTKIKLLISDNSSNPQPTFSNVRDALQKIDEDAEQGAFIFVHFSGHGSQRETVLDPDKVPWKHGKDEVFIFQEGSMRDFEFRESLDRLSQKKRAVLAVLDCCHSGGLDRDDEPGQVKFRELRESDISVIESQEHEIDKATIEKWNGIGEDWWKQPRFYTLLAACGEHQKARDDSSGGPFTTSLLDVLRSGLGPRLINYERLYRTVRSRMETFKPQQVPAIRGLSNRVIFTGDQYYTPDAVAYVEKIIDNRSGIHIDLGQAHCVKVGSRYAVFPLDSDFNGDQELKYEITISKVGGLFSEAFINASNSETIPKFIERGCIAKPIHLGYHITVGILPTNNSKQPCEVLQEVLEMCCKDTNCRIKVQKLCCNQSKRVSTDNRPDFFVDVRDNYYRVLNGAKEQIQQPHLEDLKFVSGNSSELVYSAELVHQRLHRLEHYHRILNLKNKNRVRGSAAKYSFGWGDEPDPEFLDTEDGKTHSLWITNNSEDYIYFCLFDLRSGGGIQQIFPTDGGGVEDLSPHAHLEIPIDMSFPDSLRETETNSIKSVFKVFVTTRRSFFHMHQTPEFSGTRDDAEASSRGGPGGGMVNMAMMKRQTDWGYTTWDTMNVEANISKG